MNRSEQFSLFVQNEGDGRQNVYLMHDEEYAPNDEYISQRFRRPFNASTFIVKI